MTFKELALFLLIAGTIFTACNGNAVIKKKDVKTAPGEELIQTESAKTGQFSFDGLAYTGKLSSQYLDNKPGGKFSVLCQQDLDNNMFALFQIVFPTEAEAAGAGSFKPAEGFYSLEKGEAHIAVSGYGKIGDKEYTTQDKSTGTIEVKNRVLTITNLQLFTSDGKTNRVDASISF
ncbi:MAG: hypothetical protein V4717_01340 [Bacteroidota bacterium]